MKRRCMGCMNLVQDPVCPHCGFPESAQNENHQLPIGAVLREQYVVGRCLGQGGFGITYLGWDQNLEEPVAIKEYFPNGQVSRSTYRSTVVECTAGQDLFQEGRDRFLREARTLAKLRKMPNIVQVHSFFPENNTAYIIMEYVEGITLLEYMKQRGGRLTVSETFAILGPVLKVLSQVHQSGMIHRDISPDNIMLRDDGTVKLLDFGTARDVVRSGGQLTHSTQAVLKHGFAPMEQYSGGRAIDQRADEYALCATAWCCLTGKVPPDAPSLIMDGSRIDWSGIPGLTEQQTAALEKGTAFRADDRFPDLIALHEALFGAPPEFTTRRETTLRLPTEPEVPAQQPVTIPGTLPLPEQPPQPVTIPETVPMPEPPPQEQEAPEAATIPEPPKEKPKWAAAPPEEIIGGQTEQSQAVPDPVPAPVQDSQTKRLLPAIVAIVIFLFVGIYCFRYSNARGHAMQGNFSKAEDSLFMPFLTELHDPQLLDYIEAGRNMSRGQYEKARTGFRKLRGYMSASRKEKDAAYQQGIELMEKGTISGHTEADEIFTWLMDNSYTGAEETYQENRYLWGCVLIRDKDYLAAYRMLTPLKGHSGVDEVLPSLKELIYVEGQYQYTVAKNYAYAKELFFGIHSYQDSGKYLTLIRAHDFSGYSGEDLAEELMEIIDFEDAKELLISDVEIAKHFWVGKWQTKNKKYYFQIKKDFSATYNLPWHQEGDYHYVQDGVFSVGDSTSAAKAEFKFTVLTKDSMKVYCYKNDTSYTLYRK